MTQRLGRPPRRVPQVRCASPASGLLLRPSCILCLVDGLIDLVLMTDPLAGGIASLVQALVDLLVVLIGQLLEVIHARHRELLLERQAQRRSPLASSYPVSRPATRTSTVS